MGSSFAHAVNIARNRVGICVEGVPPSNRGQDARDTSGHSTAAALFVAITLITVVQGQEWTRFRGPNGQGISNCRTVPIEWTEKDYNWKVELPAKGHGSPVIWQDKVFLTCERPEPTGGMLLALSVSDGGGLWRKEYELTPYRFHNDNSYATSTPVVDADAVYVLWQTSAETVVAALPHRAAERHGRGFDQLEGGHHLSICSFFVPNIAFDRWFSIGEICWTKSDFFETHLLCKLF